MNAIEPRGCKERLASLLALLALAVVALLLVGWLSHALDPDIRREQLARERIRTQQAPAREAALTTALWGAVAIGLGTAAGLGLTLVMERRAASRHLRADPATGLYPVVREAAGVYANANEPRAQTLAALAAVRRPTAASVARVLDAPTMPALSEPLGRPESGANWPARVEIYQAPIARDLALPVGVDGDGRAVSLPLRNLGNVLIGGLPGGGKSELLASMIAGLLRQDATGQRVQIAAVDTKLVTFGNLPHLAALYAPPALEIEDAHALTDALLAEVRRRFQLLHAAGARSVEEYRERTGDNSLPYLVTVIDELADLTADHDRRRAAAWTGAAMEIGRKGRAAGVALVMATQRPSADVIPSSLRNLAGAAVAFRLARADDSRLVLDAAGAEVLPATPGRCLVRHRETVQVQAYYAGLEGGQFDRYCAAQPLQLAAADDGIAVDDWPTTGGAAPVPPVAPVVQRLQPGRDPDAQLAAQLRQMHADGWSKTALCRAAWGYKDGIVWGILDRVLAGDP